MASPSASPHGQDWDVIIGNEVQKLRESKIVFNPPPKMRQGQTERIEARIPFEDIGPTLIEGLKGKGVPQVENIKVGSIMKVVLTGDQDAFVIQKFSSDEQTVAGKPFAQWEWDVTPLQSGNHSLHLQVTATIYVPGRGEKPYDIPVLHRQIEVEIDAWYASKRFVGENWQWLWTTLVIPVGAWLWNKRRKKRRRARVA